MQIFFILGVFFMFILNPGLGQAQENSDKIEEILLSASQAASNDLAPQEACHGARPIPPGRQVRITSTPVSNHSSSS